jgi:hypothetical protein
MSSVVMHLAALYAEHGLEEVKTVDRYRELCAEHEGNPGLAVTLNAIRDVYEGLEQGLSGMPREQVKYALEEVAGYAGDEERLLICRELVLHRFSSLWSEAQRIYFHDASQKLQEWRPFFLSFTTYHPTKGEVLHVNNRHQRLIDAGLQQTFGPPHTLEVNLLARLINYLLESVSLKGYYYPNHKDVRDVEPKLKDYAGRAQTFVQVVQNSMFSRWPSYCKIEFDAAVADKERPLVFVMSDAREEFIERADVNFRLRDWYDCVVRKEALTLRRAKEQAEVDEVLEDLKEHVVNQVRRSRRQMFDAIPA